MTTVEEWLKGYRDISRDLIEAVTADDGCYSDEKLVLVEAALEQRQEMLSALGVMAIGEEERALYVRYSTQLQGLEEKIETAVKAMMSEIENEQTALQDQRAGMNRQKKANRSYAGMAQSVGGYFIDKKK